MRKKGLKETRNHLFLRFDQSGSQFRQGMLAGKHSLFLLCAPDVYHVHFAKAAFGKGGRRRLFEKPDSKPPMPGHFVVPPEWRCGKRNDAIPTDPPLDGQFGASHTDKRPMTDC